LAVNIRELRHRITIQSISRSSDGQGGWTIGWITLAEVWAKVTPKVKKEIYSTEQIRPVSTHEIIIRHLDGISADARILFDGRVFQIKGIKKEEEQRFFMYIDAEENVAS